MLDHIVYASATLIALMAPIGELPVFLSIMSGRLPVEHRRGALTVAFGSLIVLAVAALLGRQLLDWFSVSLPAFRAAGGLVLILVGLELLQGKFSPVLGKRKSDPEDHLWVPMIMPLTAGPAAITTVITLSIAEPRPAGVPVGTLIAIVIANVVVFVTLLLASPISRAIRPRVARVLERFFGLILVAVGFEMGLGGIQQFFTAGA